jgi:hypothetical protein
MKTSELLAAVQAGKPLLCVEYRSSLVDNIKWRDKESGRAMAGTFLSHQVEFGPTSLQPAGTINSLKVSERVAEGTDLTAYTSPHKKGAKCVLTFEAFKREKGVYTASGTLAALVE